MKALEREIQSAKDDVVDGDKQIIANGHAS